MRKFVTSFEEWNQQGILSVLGTTASGKSRAVINFLRQNKKSDFLLVSVDSVAAYKNLDIGSAKPRGLDRSDFDWLGLDLFSPDQKVDAAAFQKKVFPSIKAAVDQNQPVILVGGSHFYERFLVEGASPGSASDSDFQKNLEKETSQAIADNIIQCDLRFKEKVNPTDRYRLTRLADLVLRQNLNYEQLFLQEKKDSLLAWNTCLIHSLEKDISAIQQRVESMFDEGWVQEVKELIQSYGAQAPALETTGYKEIRDALLVGECGPKLKELIKTRHAQLAKKQRTWLRKLNATA